MLTAPFVAIDTETNGQDVRDGRGFLQGISIAYRAPNNDINSAYFPIRHPDTNLDPASKYSLYHMLRLVKRPVFFNAKFDLQVLLNEGVDFLESLFEDCMLMAHLINENYPFQKSLEMVCRYYLDIDKAKFKDKAFDNYCKKVGWVMPSGMMWEYAVTDAEMTIRLWEVLQRKADMALTERVWPVKREVVKLVRQMENPGVLINQDLCRKMTTIGETQLAELTDLIGGNLGSGKFLEELLIGRLGLPVVKTSAKTGNPSFDKEAMAEYDDLLSFMDNPLAKQIFTYRGWQKSVSSNYRAYLELVSPDGRLRPNFKMHGTKTGRFSCEKPNLQQIPRVSDKPWNGAMKQCFIPEPGFVLLEADYSQLELRLATAYGKVSSLQDVFNQGRDVFTEMALELGMARQDVKTLVYSIQYGAGLDRLMHVFGINREQAAALKALFYQRYPGFKHINESARSLAVRDKKVPIWTGRYRHFLRDENPGKALNAIIQGGAADIMERTMLRVNAGMINDDCRMILQVHDSIVLEVREEFAADASRDIQRLMESVEPNFEVKFAVEVKQWGK